MVSFHNWTGDELIDTQVPQFLNEDNKATQEKLDTKLGKNETAAAAVKDGVGNKIVDTYAKKTDIPNITVDNKLSDTSTNPVQNRVITTNMDDMLTQINDSLDVISSNIPTKVSELENDAGYLTQHQSLDDYAKKNTANTWSAQQSFKQVILGAERYLSPVVSGSSNTPQMSVMHYIATGAFTLSLLKIVASLEVRNSTVFTAYIESSADYPLNITDAGTLKYIGSASDVAITSAGLLLNILITRDTNDNVTSIVQASKLS